MKMSETQFKQIDDLQLAETIKILHKNLIEELKINNSAASDLLLDKCKALFSILKLYNIFNPSNLYSISFVCISKNIDSKVINDYLLSTKDKFIYESHKSEKLIFYFSLPKQIVQFENN